MRPASTGEHASPLCGAGPRAGRSTSQECDRSRRINVMRLCSAPAEQPANISLIHRRRSPLAPPCSDLPTRDPPQLEDQQHRGFTGRSISAVRRKLGDPVRRVALDADKPVGDVLDGDQAVDLAAGEERLEAGVRDAVAEVNLCGGVAG